MRAEREIHEDVDMSKFAKNDVVYYSYLTLDTAPDVQRPRNLSWTGSMFTEPMTHMPIDQVMRSNGCGSSFFDENKRIQQVIDQCSRMNKLFIWSIGGPGDLTYSFKNHGRDIDQTDHFVDKVIQLLHYGGDGVDLSFYHLSQVDRKGNNKRDLMSKLIPKLRRKMDESNMTKAKIVYTGRYNCFQGEKPTPGTSLMSQDTDGECLDALNVTVVDPVTNETKLVADMVDWVNVMFYDAPMFKAMQNSYFHEKEFIGVAKSAMEVLKDGSKIMVGMKPGFAGNGWVWEGFQMDLNVIAKLKGMVQEDGVTPLGTGGMFLFSMNDETPHGNDPSTPYSVKHKDRKSIGANARYLVGEARGVEPDPTDPDPTIKFAAEAEKHSDELPVPALI